MTNTTQSQSVPKVSIGMPVYNGEKYIQEALDSLLNQSFADFELIISDNCSTDSTYDICKKYANKDSRIKVIRQASNIGATANFEFVLNQSNCDYFMWAAADDRWEANFIHQVLNELLNDLNCQLAFCFYQVKDLKSEKSTYHNVIPSDSNLKALNYIIRSYDICPSLIYGIFKTSSIKNTKLRTFDFADVHFVSEVAIQSKVKIVRDYLYIAGTNGVRKPYSLNGTRINRLPFLSSQFKLLKKHFWFPINIGLFLLLSISMAYNKIRLWRY